MKGAFFRGCERGASHLLPGEFQGGVSRECSAPGMSYPAQPWEHTRSGVRLRKVVTGPDKLLLRTPSTARTLSWLLTSPATQCPPGPNGSDAGVSLARDVVMSVGSDAGMCH